MYIHDDADTATVVSQTVAAIKEGARHIGKADRGMTPDQIKDVEEAIALLQSMVRLKK